MNKSDFDYGPIAIGIFKALLWLTLVVVAINVYLLVIYVPFLLFLAFGLKPFLIKTGLAATYQGYSAQRADKANEKLRKAYYARNAETLDKRNKHLDDMRKKMAPKVK